MTPQCADDPPGIWQALTYSEFVGMDHKPPAADWTQNHTPGVREWLFAQALGIDACPADMDADFDVDGVELAALIGSFDSAKMAGFASNFGNFFP